MPALTVSPACTKLGAIVGQGGIHNGLEFDWNVFRVMFL